LVSCQTINHTATNKKFTADFDSSMLFVRSLIIEQMCKKVKEKADEIEPPSRQGRQEDF
jgi:hypothetical protein